MSSFNVRVMEDEIMDQPGLDDKAHIAALNGIRRVNWISGVNRLMWRSLQEFITPQSSDPLRVLDIASGGGDVLIRLAQQADREGVRIKFEGIDKSRTAVDFAQEKANRLNLSNVRFFQQDALNDPHENAYDVVMSTLFMHHLSEEQAVLLLKRMSAAATKGILLDDLCRSQFGYLLAWCGVRLLSRSPICHFDGPVSVKAAFRPVEVHRLAEMAGLSHVEIHRHWPQRFLLKWKREEC